MRQSVFADVKRCLLLTAVCLALTTAASAASITIGDGLSASEAERCKAAVSLAVTRLSQVFPWLHSGKLPRVRFFLSSVSNRAASPWVGGLYHANEHRIDIQHVPVLLTQGRLEHTVQHEFVHAALALAGSTRLPLWLEEGAAIYLSAEILDESTPSLQAAKTIAELENKLVRFNHSRTHTAWQHLKTYNRQARAIVAALIERNGLEHFGRFVRTLKNGTRFVQALASWYSLTPEDLAAWL